MPFITAGIFAHKILGKRTARNPESFSFKGGMETLIKKLADNPAISFQSNYQVEKIIQHAPYHWEVLAKTPHGERQCSARHVVLSSPAETAAQLLLPLNQALGKALSSIQYAPLSVVHLGYEKSALKHPLDSAGFLVPRQEKMSMAIPGLYTFSLLMILSPDFISILYCPSLGSLVLTSGLSDCQTRFWGLPQFMWSIY